MYAATAANPLSTNAATESSRGITRKIDLLIKLPTAVNTKQISQLIIPGSPLRHYKQTYHVDRHIKS
jgi:hypothetical protein